jgi:hypothetical protein
VPHFGAQRPDHSPPELLGDDELARAIDSLQRKLRSARRMLAVATMARVTFFGVMLVSGFAILWVGPAPFLELIQGQRVLATTWDVFAWWFAVLAVASVVGALLTQASRRRRRRAAGWQSRVADLERRLGDATRVLDSRRTA